MPKSPDAFRTISEVADWLGIQAHVLRFWESKFTQVKPIKRAGGRRYYRPNDMLLLGGIKKLLHDDGLTIKGVQKILREEGMNHVAAMSVPLDDLSMSEMETAPAKPAPPPAPMIEDAEPETGVVLPFDAPPEPQEDVKKAAEPHVLDEEKESDTRGAEAVSDLEPTSDTESPEPEQAAVEEAAPDVAASQPADLAEPMEAAGHEPEPEAEPTAPSVGASAEPDPVSVPPHATPEAEPQAAIEEEPASEDASPEPVSTQDADLDDSPADDAAMEPLPSFLRHPADAGDGVAEARDDSAAEAEPVQDNMPPEPEEPEAPPAPAPRARDIGMPEVTPEAEIHAEPGALSAALRQTRISPAQVDQLRPLLAQLSALRDSMASQRPPPAKD